MSLVGRVRTRCRTGCRGQWCRRLWRRQGSAGWSRCFVAFPHC